MAGRIIHKLIWPSGVVLLSLLVAYLIFKDYLFHPNKYMFAFGGDALAIYYNMAYHVCFGQGTMLTNMNYPYGEYIFLTDAQGSFSTVLQYINRHLFNVCDCVPGAVHVLNIFLLPLCSVLIFYIFRYFNVRHIPALVFSVLITFLSPQMLRFGGHYGLGYPFVIPMVILWFLRKHKVGVLEKRDALVFGTLLFFTFNNPYIGFSASGFLICAGVIYLLLSIRNKLLLKRGLIVGGIGLLAAFIPFLNFTLFDPFPDRVKQQWGFFFYNASLDGLFYPPRSVFNEILTWMKVKLPETLNESESWMNIGFACTLLLAAMLIRGLIRVLKKNNTVSSRDFTLENKIMLGSAALMFLYAANSNLYGFAEKWMEANLGKLLMFKASSRIGWSFYFALTITCVIFLDQMLKKIRSQLIAYGILLLLSTIWIYEIQNYIKANYKDVFHNNYFQPSSRQEIKDILQSNQIDTKEFQAILVLPRMMAWTDVFISNIVWAAQFYSMRISEVTGLPLISSMLSRMSVSQTAEAIQMLSNPLIERELIKKLPNQKDILLLLGHDNSQLMVGEKYLIEISKPLVTTDGFSLYRLSLNDLLAYKHIELAREYYRQQKVANDNVIHLSFDEESMPVRFYGSGSKLISEGSTTIMDQALETGNDSLFVFSAWTTFDDRKGGVGNWEIIVSDSTGQTISQHPIETRRSNDIQGTWIRSETVFRAIKGSKVKAVIHADREFYLDEVFVYPATGNHIIDEPGSPYFLFNGFKVAKSRDGN